MNLQFFQVDAFTDILFKGNPAAVMKLDSFLPDELMQNIAAENNLAETAFVVPRGDAYHLRWFTPTLEADFCGHATIGTAHVLRTSYGLTPPFRFNTRAGVLIVDFVDGLYVMDAPIILARPTLITEAMKIACPFPIETAFWGNNNLFLVLSEAKHVEEFVPDFEAIKPISTDGVAITALSQTGDYDCISRYFAPLAGIPEDPVTGSAHAAIGPYWAARLGKGKLKAYQASKRGGVLWLDIGTDRLTISGHAVTYMKAEMTGL